MTDVQALLPAPTRAQLTRPPPLELSDCVALPRMTVTAAQAANRIFRRDEPALVHLSDGDYEFRWLPRTRPFAGECMLHLAIGRWSAWLGLASLGPFELLGSQAAAQMPAVLRKLALLDLASSALGPIEQVLGERIHLLDAHRHWRAPRGSVRLHFLLRNQRSGAASWGCFQPEHDGLLERVAEAWFARPISAARSLNHVSVLLRFELGMERLAMKQLRDLQPGDALRMRAAHSEGTPIPVWIRPNVRAGEDIVGVAQGSRITITEVRKAAMQADDDNSIRSRGGAPMQEFDSLPVTISFDLGQQPATIAELRDLRPGCTLELGCSVDQSVVRVLANGALFATGHLVAVGDMLCVRITSLRDAERD